MRALRIHSYGASPQLDDVEPPSRPGPGEITVDVSAVGVGTWDLGVLSGRLSRLVPPERLPAVLGAEFAGRVRALGVGVEGFDLGDVDASTDTTTLDDN